MDPCTVLRLLLDVLNSSYLMFLLIQRSNLLLQHFWIMEIRMLLLDVLERLIPSALTDHCELHRQVARFGQSEDLSFIQVYM